MGSNKFELVILVDPTKANQAIGSVNTSILGLERRATSSSGSMARVWEKSAMDAAQATRGTNRAMKDAADAAELLGAQIGIHLPREVRKFIGESKLLGTALSGLFKFSIYLAAGEALISWVGRIGEKLGWWGDQADKAAKENDELTRSVKEQAKQIEDYYTKLDQMQRARGLIGLSGSARGSREVGYARSDVNTAKIEYEAASAQYNRITLDLMRARNPRRTGFTGNVQDLVKQGEEASKLLLEKEQAYMLAKEQLTTVTLELAQAQREEIEKSKGPRDLNAWRARQMQNWLSDRTAGLVGPGSVGISDAAQSAAAAAAGVMSDADDAAFVKDWRDRRAEAVASLARENESMRASQLKAAKDYLGVQAIELSRLDEMKKLYADNAEAIAQIEERKKLVIQDTNTQIAQDAQDKFEKSASAIEGFFNRVFLTARSFGDVWRQLWGQIANYAVSQLARIAAASLAGMRAPGGVGGVGGMALQGATGQATSGLIGKALGGVPWLGGLFGGGAGAATAAASSAFGTSGMIAGMSGVSTSAAVAGGAGGIGGMLGSMTGFLTNPWTIGIAAAAIGGYALFKLFQKSAEEKAQQKIKATYGVNIQNKGVLRQVVEIAKQNFGGNLDMAIRSATVEELVRLYAMTTGQSAHGMRAQMAPATFMQSGGGLSMLPTYSNGLPGSGIDRIGAGVSSGSGSIVIQLDGPATTKVLQGEAVTAIINNPRAVQTANTKATSSNFNRRALTSLQLSPGTLTS